MSRIRRLDTYYEGVKIPFGILRKYSTDPKATPMRTRVKLKRDHSFSWDNWHAGFYKNNEQGS